MSSSFINPLTFTNNAGATPALSDQSPSVRLYIGPHSWPEQAPAATIPELFYMLQHALPNTPNLTRDAFMSNTFVIAFDLRKTIGDPSSSVSTRSGDLIRCDLLNLTADAATSCVVTMMAYSVTAIRESGVTLLTYAGGLL